MKREPHHYRECGLNYVYLANGFSYKQTRHGKTVSIQDMDGLHRAIGAHLAREKRELTGADLRFLRKELGLSQKLLGMLLGKSAQTVARWEKGQTRIDATAERLVRLLYAQPSGGYENIKNVLQGLASLDSLIEGEVCFEDTENGWQLRPAA